MMLEATTSDFCGPIAVSDWERHKEFNYIWFVSFQLQLNR